MSAVLSVPTIAASAAAAPSASSAHRHFAAPAVARVAICSDFAGSRHALTLQSRRSAPDSAVAAHSHVASPVCALPSLAETSPAPVFGGEGGAVSQFPAAAGIYAIFDKAGTLQYMGLSRRLAASLQAHSEDLPELCDSVKLAVVAASEKAALVDAWKQWMQEHVSATGTVPPGNESGNTTWTTRRAKRVKPDLKLVPGPHVKLNIPMQELIGKLVKEHRVVAFIKGTRSSPQCGFSHRVLTLLNEVRADFETLNVLDEDHNPGLREAIKEYSQWPTIPQIFVNGEFIGGADIVEEMAQSGELKDVVSAPTPAKAVSS
eukprot:TRINITY_DN25970_c0_g1_i1.p1 TRINITY_DN25970_c0_g1~~TRINITY_DN25970_c0_g1_i1.p1  ORF type:complete len:367 (-),score=18.29 TRINITY_DN25970_c0_g1_i1:229-1182(-)